MPDMSSTSLLGLGVPNILEPVGLEGAGRLIWSTLLLGLGLAAVLVMARRPKPAEPATWAQTMGGAVFVLALMVLAYGTVPHEWLTFASKELNWGKDTFLVEDGGIVPFDINRNALADIVAVLIYAVALGVNVFLFSMWQKRPVAAPPAEGEEPAPPTTSRWRRRAKGTSAYGRPLTAQE